MPLPVAFYTQAALLLDSPQTLTSTPSLLEATRF